MTQSLHTWHHAFFQGSFTTRWRFSCWVAFVALWTGTLMACGTPQTQPKTSAARYVMTTALEPLSSCRADAPSSQWAVIVGVNDYQDEGISDLQGAVNDAWNFYHFLSSPAGGAVSPVRMKLLLNEEATREAVVGALGKFLANACPQDQVIIYFAGHGLPEPERPEEAFLLVHDTRLTNLVGSAISMNQLPQFLKWRANKAGNLVMFVDACHSGSIQFPGQGTRGGRPPKERMQLVAQGITQAIEKQKDKGWGAISAAASEQFALEIKQGCLIGDYPYEGGLFTCHLLKGLSGTADYDDNGKIELGELFSYLDRSVQRDSRGQQAPQLSGSLDKTMTVSHVSTSRVGIPVLPEKYTGTESHPLRPWIYGSAGIALASGVTGVVYALMSQDALDKAQNTFGHEKTALEQEANNHSRLSLSSYGVAATIGSVALGGLLYDLLKKPEDIEDVYQRPPRFELSVSPPSSREQRAELRWKLHW